MEPPNYRDATEKGKSCRTCGAYQNGKCLKFQTEVSKDKVCDEWQEKKYFPFQEKIKEIHSSQKELSPVRSSLYEIGRKLSEGKEGVHHFLQLEEDEILKAPTPILKPKPNKKHIFKKANLPLSKYKRIPEREEYDVVVKMGEGDQELPLKNQKTKDTFLLKGDNFFNYFEEVGSEDLDVDWNSAKLEVAALSGLFFDAPKYYNAVKDEDSERYRSALLEQARERAYNALSVEDRDWVYERTELRRKLEHRNFSTEDMIIFLKNASTIERFSGHCGYFIHNSVDKFVEKLKNYKVDASPLSIDFVLCDRPAQEMLTGKLKKGSFYPVNYGTVDSRANEIVGEALRIDDPSKIQEAVDSPLQPENVFEEGYWKKIKEGSEYLDSNEEIWDEIETFTEAVEEFNNEFIGDFSSITSSEKNRFLTISDRDESVSDLASLAMQHDDFLTTIEQKINNNLGEIKSLCENNDVLEYKGAEVLGLSRNSLNEESISRLIKNGIYICSFKNALKDSNPDLIKKAFLNLKKRAVNFDLPTLQLDADNNSLKRREEKVDFNVLTCIMNPYPSGLIQLTFKVLSDIKKGKLKYSTYILNEKESELNLIENNLEEL